MVERIGITLRIALMILAASALGLTTDTSLLHAAAKKKAPAKKNTAGQKAAPKKAAVADGQPQEDRERPKTSAPAGEKEPGENSRFAETSSGTVLDRNTGLIWLKNANVLGTPLPLQLAEQYIADMNASKTPNFGNADWRLPNITELDSLIDSSRIYPALPFRHPFVDVQNDFYWSSSKGSDIADYTWTLDIASGIRTVDYLSYCNYKYLWPVRSGWVSKASRWGVVLAGGRNKYGQLGDQSAENRVDFAIVADLDDAVKIAAGDDHSLAVTRGGTVWAWGSNGNGRLGDGTNVNRTAPTLVKNLWSVIDIAAGMQHSLVLKADGTVWAWGDNSFRQLGNELIAQSHVPMQVDGLASVTKIASGTHHSAALKSDGTVWTWGKNTAGQLGDGTTTMRALPAAVPDLTKVVDISANVGCTAALKSDGTVWVWGNARGLLGDGISGSSPVPVKVEGLSGVSTISAGWDHMMALKSDGTVWVWGSNENEQLGIGGGKKVSAVAMVPGLKHIKKIAAGMTHSVALASNGMIATWGKDLYIKSSPYAITYVQDVFEIAAGKEFTLVISGK